MDDVQKLLISALSEEVTKAKLLVQALGMMNQADTAEGIIQQRQEYHLAIARHQELEAELEEAMRPKVRQ